MKLTHVKLVTSNFDPRHPGAGSLQGVTDFAEADGYELELRSDGLVSVTYGDEIALFSAGQLRHARAKRERTTAELLTEAMPMVMLLDDEPPIPITAHLTTDADIAERLADRAEFDAWEAGSVEHGAPPRCFCRPGNQEVCDVCVGPLGPDATPPAEQSREANVGKRKKKRR